MSVQPSSGNLVPFLRAHPSIVTIGLCALFTISLWYAQLTPYLNVADDSGRYMVLGESIARTGDLRLLNSPNRPLDTLYPPGFPAIIASCLLITGRDVDGIVLLVKVIQLLLLLATLPLFYRLLMLARLSSPYRSAAMIAYAACPATVGYANEIMSEIPLLFFCLASIVVVERYARMPDVKHSNGEAVPSLPSSRSRSAQVQEVASAPSSSLFPLPSSLLFAAAAFLTRTSGIALLMVLVVWFWRRYGKVWGLIACLTLILTVGGWLGRNRHIIKTHPKLHYSTYLDQFTLRNPAQMNGGRIALTPLGLASRMKSGLPTYIGMVPRAILYMMAPPNTWRLALFYLVAIPLTLLILVGLVLIWRRGMVLSVSFTVLFWFVAAIWPWQSARFLVPLVPFMLLFAAAGVEFLSTRFSVAKFRLGVVIPWGFALLMLYYYADVHLRVIHQERRPTASGYASGRSREEGGFYSACSWLKHNTPAGSIIMGKPAYLLHLYSGRPTWQIEPTSNARVQELAYIVKEKIDYLVEDSWSFGFVTKKLLASYFLKYGDHWDLAWNDPVGSGVRIWKRK